MNSLRKSILAALAVLGAVASGFAFSMQGPPAAWQTRVRGYDYNVTRDIIERGPMGIGEGYRWNLPVVYYAYDSTFIAYFGPTGFVEAEKAFAMLNALTNASKMDPSLSSFPLEGRRLNGRAQALNMMDLKSRLLSNLLRQVGMTDPSQYVWTISDHAGNIACSPPYPHTYGVIKRNYDPVQPDPVNFPWVWSSSSYINGVLYTYNIQEIFDGSLPCLNLLRAEAVEQVVDPLYAAYNPRTAVASYIMPAGQYVTSLTRDDVGGLRHLYINSTNANLLRYEYYPDGVVTSTNPPPPNWPLSVPYDGGSNAPPVLARRPGIDKINFQRVDLIDQLTGQFYVPITNKWWDVHQAFTNGVLQLVSNRVERIVTRPDLYIQGQDFQALNARVAVTIPFDSWTNSAASSAPGPGTILPQQTITFNTVDPYLVNFHPNQLSELTAEIGLVWGTFDGSTNAPVLYPPYYPLQDWELYVLQGQSGF